MAQETLQGWAEDARKKAGTIIVLGVVTVIAGFLALGMPWAGGVGVVFMVGFALMVGGIARVTAAFGVGSFGRGTLAFVGGALGLLAGVLMVTRPGVGLATLTLVLGAYLVVDGIFGAVLGSQKMLVDNDLVADRTRFRVEYGFEPAID